MSGRAKGLGGCFWNLHTKCTMKHQMANDIVVDKTMRRILILLDGKEMKIGDSV